jgi:hypothetical protein
MPTGKALASFRIGLTGYRNRFHLDEDSPRLGPKHFSVSEERRPTEPWPVSRSSSRRDRGVLSRCSVRAYPSARAHAVDARPARNGMGLRISGDRRSCRYQSAYRLTYVIDREPLDVIDPRSTRFLMRMVWRATTVSWIPLAALLIPRQRWLSGSLAVDRSHGGCRLRVRCHRQCADHGRAPCRVVPDVRCHCTGAVGMLDGSTRTAGATAMEHVDPTLVKANPDSLLGMMSLLCHRLRWTTSIIGDAAFLSLPARLAKRLLILAEHYGGVIRRPSG